MCTEDRKGRMYVSRRIEVTNRQIAQPHEDMAPASPTNKSVDNTTNKRERVKRIMNTVA